MTSLEENTDCVVHLNTSDIVGLAFITEAGVISSVAVLIFAGLVVRNVIETRRHPGLGAVTNAKWAADGKVTCSAYCTAQGALQQLGETGVALSTLVITLHTFATVVFRWQPSHYPWLWMIVVACIWIFLLLFVVIGYVVHQGAERRGGTPYFGPTPFWCWIGSNYVGERIAGEYFWLWFCAFASIVLYPFLFFMLRGNIDVDPDNWRRITFHRRRGDGIFGSFSSPMRGGHSGAEATMQDKARNKEAMKMFWYPISYTILVGPLSINRWRSSFKPSSNAGVETLSIVPTSVVLFIFGLSGLCNVLLFLLTRPNLLLFNVRRQLKRERFLQQLSQVTSTRISFANPRQSSGAASSPSALGIHQRTARRRDDVDEEEDWDEGYFEDARRRSDIELPDEPNYPPPPSQSAPLPPPPASPNGSPFSGGANRPGEAVRMSTLGSPRESIPPFTGYENHHSGADDSIMRRTSAVSLRYTTATASAGGNISAGNGGRSAGGSGLSPTRFREHFHDDAPVSAIRTIPMNQRLPKQQSMTLPVMPEQPSMLRRQISSGLETEETPLTALPPPPDAIYSRSASRIPPSSPTVAVTPPAVPPTGHPPPENTRSRVEEWALGTAPPQPRGPAP